MILEQMFMRLLILLLTFLLLILLIMVLFLLILFLLLIVFGILCPVHRLLVNLLKIGFVFISEYLPVRICSIPALM